jgi:transposase
VAGRPGAVRPLAYAVQSLPPLAACRRVGPRARRGPSPSRRGRAVGLDGPLRRWDRYPGAPACCRGQGGDPATEALGRSQGGFSTKVHLRAEGGGKLLTFLLTPGQQHEATVFEQLLEQGAVKRPGRGRPRVRPDRVVGDKGYTGRRLRAYCRRRGVRYTIPRQRRERRHGPFDRAADRLRHRVECLINRCKQFRSLATRYDKRADSYRTLWVLAAILLWLPI